MMGIVKYILSYGLLWFVVVAPSISLLAQTLEI